MELYDYSTKELENEIERRAKIEKNKSIYFGFSNTTLMKNRRNEGKIIELAYPYSEDSVEYNLYNIKKYKVEGYRIVLIISQYLLQYNKILADYADEVITY